MCEALSRYQNSTGADSPKFALERGDHVPKFEHFNPINSCLIRDDLHIRAHLRAKEHVFAPALKVIWRTRAQRLFQWHAKNGHENFLLTEEKSFTMQEQYNNQNKKIYAQTSLEVHSEGAGRPSPFLRHGLLGGVPSGVTNLHFCKKGVKMVSERIKRTCCKKLWNILAWSSSLVRNGSSSRTQFLTKRLRQLRSGRGWTFWTSSAPRIDFRGVQASKSWTINCGLFSMTWRVDSVTTAWRAWRDPLWRQRQRSPWRRSMRRQQSGRRVSRLASRYRAAILSDVIINEKLKLFHKNYLARKVDVLFNFPSKAHCTFNRIYGKTVYKRALRTVGFWLLSRLPYKSKDLFETMSSYLLK